MKTMLEVCMYSGGCVWDPRCEMTEEQTQTLTEKVLKLNIKAGPNRFGTGVLGADSFMISFGMTEIREDGFEQVENYTEYLKGLQFTMIMALPGRISVYKCENGLDFTDEMYEDTESIHSFLSDLAAPAIQAHHQKANEQIQAYWDSLGDTELKK